MPTFTVGDDPGSSFPELLRRVGLHPSATLPTSGSAELMRALSVPHATTCVALRYDNGVVMAGDRRATAGNLISHRTMEKVVQADRHSGVAIAGAAGPAIEMIRLFQLQLEHYEKVEGSTLSLEGKANQLSTMVRGNLPAAMQGMVVVPIFAGYDLRRDSGRLWDFDATGGRYEERDYVATGSGSLHAGTVIKVGWRDIARPRRGREPRLPGAVGGRRRDSATGGPDVLRGIYPIVAHHRRRRLAPPRRRRSRPALRRRSSTRCVRDEHAVLRRPRTDDEGPRRLRRARASPAGGRSSRSASSTAS